MSRSGRVQLLVGVGILMSLAIGGLGSAQTSAPTNDLPNPYRAIENWAKLPEGRTWGSTSGVDIDPDGTSVWVAERCGAFAPPSLHETRYAVRLRRLDARADPQVRCVRHAGEELRRRAAPVPARPARRSRRQRLGDRRPRQADGKGHQVFKFSPDGKLLLTLGKAGVAGSGPDEFNAPSAVVVAPNGDIFVADGHRRAAPTRAS